MMPLNELFCAWVTYGLLQESGDKKLSRPLYGGRQALSTLPGLLESP